jgi:hypothetical protein
MTRNHGCLGFLRWLLLLVTVGCQSSPADDQDCQNDNGSSCDSRMSILERCEGAFACTLYEDGSSRGTTKGDLVMRGEECWWRDDEGTPFLNLSDPQITLYDTYFAWMSMPGGAGGLQLVFECLPLEAASGTGTEKTAKCRGLATDCQSLGLDCDSQDGCSWDIGDAFTGSDDRCTGAADSCDSYDRQSDCEHQRGCRWAI